MAVTLKHQFTSTISTVVNNAINSVRAIRSTEQARKESEFQKAIANGLSYEEQLAFRQEQLDEEKASSFNDKDYVLSLENSIVSTKKLIRFNKYRLKYAKSLGDLSSGKINEETYLDTLVNYLNTVQDPDLRLEIQQNITDARAKVKEYNDTILSNQVKKATYDGSKTELTNVINSVNKARTNALINDNQDEVTSYDETLAALNSQLSTVDIQDSLTDFQVKSSTKGTSSLEKLNFINDKVSSSNDNYPVTIGGRTFNSVREYWGLQRDSYLNGSSQIFGDFFSELQTEANNVINSNTAKFGYPTQVVIDSTNKTFTDLAGKEEMQPYLNKLDITKATVMTTAVDSYAKKIVDAATTTLEYEYADTQLEALGTKYGIDTSSYRNSLFQTVRGLELSGYLNEGTTAALAARLQVEIPEVTKTTIEETTPTPTPTVTPTPTPTPSTTDGTYVIKSGDTLSSIAASNNTTVEKLIELNPEYKDNPNLIQTGKTIKTTGATPTPTPMIEDTTPTPTPEPVVEPTAPTPTTTPTTTPTPEATPTTTPTPTPTYTGTSVVDYLKSTGADSSFNARQKLAQEKGITDYTGSPEQNTKLLNLLKE